MIRLVRLLDFLSTHIDSFGEGVIFSAATLAARCNGDSRAEHFLQETAKGATYAERLESLLQSLVRLLLNLTHATPCPAAKAKRG